MWHYNKEEHSRWKRQEAILPQPLDCLKKERYTERVRYTERYKERTTTETQSMKKTGPDTSTISWLSRDQDKLVSTNRWTSTWST